MEENMNYSRRVIDDLLDDLLPELPAILLDGPKGVGKTETALQRAKTVFRLDVAAQLQVVQASTESALQQPAPVLFDEWQNFPGIWGAVKNAADSQTGPKGPFLLTGSAYVPAAVTHTGAGRIYDIRMRPMTLPERGVASPTVSLSSLLKGESAINFQTTTIKLEDYVDEILASGLPGIRRLSSRGRSAQLESYLRTIVQKDMEEAGQKIRKPETVMAWLRAYAGATSSTTNWNKILDAASPGQDLKPAKTTVMPYIETLTSLRILDELPGWTLSNNPLKRLTAKPKHHLADPALAAKLLGLTKSKLLTGQDGNGVLLRNGGILGALFESLVAMSVRVFAQPVNASVFHLRTADDRQEIDLIVESEDGGILAIEVKLAPDVDGKDVRHLLWLKEQIPDRVTDLVIVTTGNTAYRRMDGVAVVPLALLGS